MEQAVPIAAVGFLALWLVSATTGPSRQKRRHPFAIFREILDVMDPEPLGFWLAMGALNWGLFVVTDWGRTTALPLGFPDDTLGAIIAILGAAQLVAIGWDLHRTYAFTTFGLAMAWGFLAFSAGLISNWHSAAFIVYSGGAVMSGWVWVRLRWDDAHLSAISADEA